MKNLNVKSAVRSLGFMLFIIVTMMTNIGGCSSGSSGGGGPVPGPVPGPSLPDTFVDDFTGASLNDIAWDAQASGGGAQLPDVDGSGHLELRIFNAAVDDTDVDVVLQGFGRYNIVQARMAMISASTPSVGPEVHARLGVEIQDNAGAGEAVIDLMFFNRPTNWMNIVAAIRPAVGDIDIDSFSVPVNELQVPYLLRIEVDTVAQEIRFYYDGGLFYTYTTTGLAIPANSAVFLEGETFETGASMYALVDGFSACVNVCD